MSAKPFPSPDLAIVIPTYKERENVTELVKRLREVLADVPYEIIFVDDDSPDGTANIIRDLSREDGRIRVLQRIGRRGLSSACVEGALCTSASFVAIMDADLQHDESILPMMLAALLRGEADVVIGSRYVGGGGIGEWDRDRAALSRLATAISHLIVPNTVTDPMSGFFMMSRSLFEQTSRGLSSMGFKLLADFLATAGRQIRVLEVPYQFRNRYSGESKLDSLVAWEFLLLVADKLVGRWIPVRFLSFALVGGIGVAIHLTILALLFHVAEIKFQIAQIAATLVAMVGNFALNNILTYRDARLKGVSWFWGLLTFVMACSVGAFANVGVAGFLYGQNTDWILAALAGIAVGTVWNFTVSSFYAWRVGRK
ncbi:MAG: glycosyltransferase family 2 protein [Gammaproteobacteria bacterium]|nr:glycosyltransferase family 2 protein [Gammaproteobacteria bacterium]